MKINNNNNTDQFQNIMVNPAENKGAAQTPQVQNIMVKPEQAVAAGSDPRASMKQAESSIGANLLANLLSEGLKSLENILSKLLENMKPASTSSPIPPAPAGSLLERARRDSVQDGSIQGAGPANGASSTPHLVNNGGKVLNAPDINNIYVGNYFTTSQGQKDAAFNDAAAKN